MKKKDIIFTNCGIVIANEAVVNNTPFSIKSAKSVEVRLEGILMTKYHSKHHQ